MECEQARAISSAGLDQEAGTNELKSAENHMAECQECTIWVESLHQVNRSLRFQQVEVPDLSEQIMAAWDVAQIPKTAPSDVPLRAGLAAMGVMSVAFSLPLLIGAGSTSVSIGSSNPSRELAGLGLMMAAAFLLSARDGRARGRLAIVATGIAVTIVASLADLIAGNVTLAYEFVHVPSLIGVVLLGLMARSEPPLERSGMPMGREQFRHLGGAA